MKEIPILFSTPMVQAIQREVDPKRQTRRMFSPKILEKYFNLCEASRQRYENLKGCENVVASGSIEFLLDNCKYRKGDVLWVREAWSEYANAYAFKADLLTDNHGFKWKPSIFMPREACRLFLRVENVRVERLQNISTEDIYKEGILQYDGNPAKGKKINDCIVKPTPRENFIYLWNSINKKQGAAWEDNPFVQVVEFSRINKGDM